MGFQSSGIPVEGQQTVFSLHSLFSVSSHSLKLLQSPRLASEEAINPQMKGECCGTPAGRGFWSFCEAAVK